MQFTIPFAPVSASRPNWSAKNGRATRTYIPKHYKEWREKTNEWFEDWLEQTDYKLIRELIRLSPQASLKNKNDEGRERILVQLESKKNKNDFAENFWGFEVKMLLYVEVQNVNKPYPLASNTGDLDNYYKAVTDMMFESDSFKKAGFNDRWIQKASIMKLAVPKGEGKIIVDISRIEGDFVG